MFQKRMAPSQQGNGTTGRKKDLTVSCDETKHETTSPAQDHSITSARSNGWAECRDKKVSAPSRRRRMSLDIPFYRTSPSGRQNSSGAYLARSRNLLSSSSGS